MRNQQEALYDDVCIEQHDVGVYCLKLARPIRRESWLTLNPVPIMSDMRKRYSDGKEIASDIFRFVFEVYTISPTNFNMVMGSHVWRELRDPLSTYFRALLLQALETSLVAGDPDTKGILVALSLFLISSMISSFMEWTLTHCVDSFGEMIRTHFQLRLMRESLRNDLAAATAKDGHETASPEQAQNQFVLLCVVFGSLIGFIGQVALILNACRRVGDPFLMVLSLFFPVLVCLLSDNVFTLKCIAYNNNAADKRMKALSKLTEGKYKQDLVLGNMVDWIMAEFKKAFEGRGDVAVVGHPFQAYNQSRSKFRSKISNVAIKDIPLIYLAFLSIRNPFAVSLSSITVLAESSMRLMRLVKSPFFSVRKLHLIVEGIRKIYHGSKPRATISSGVIPYPVIGGDGEDLTNGTSNKGMRFELSNVSFSYPSSQSTKSALHNASLSIKPGQLVVLVGKNGSGKSTLIRILARLYEHTSGEVLIDHRPSSAYYLGDLQSSMALLSQDNNIFPLSLGENIGVGYPEKYEDKELIRAAADDGGASKLISKLQDGFDTKLDPKIPTWTHNLSKQHDHPLVKEHEALKKKIEISGGEKQRVVASRTFMRLNSERIKFVAVDEPTSALDADGELHLFNRLTAQRQGKTMVFVTHRFGHLTKHADLILCMDDGQLVESGVHDQLMKREGMYATLYRAQASAYI